MDAASRPFSSPLPPPLTLPLISAINGDSSRQPFLPSVPLPLPLPPYKNQCRVLLSSARALSLSLSLLALSLPRSHSPCSDLAGASCRRAGASSSAPLAAPVPYPPRLPCFAPCSPSSPLCTSSNPR
jgi:hypothetical protein